MLTKISMWDDKHGWQHTTATAISSKFPYSISADSRIFLCELCGQYATFVNGGYNTAHFKHPKGSNDCDEKTTSYSYRYATNPLGFSLPLCIKLSINNIEVFIGFLPLPANDLANAEKIKAQLTITANGKSKIYNIDSSRISSNKVSYLSIGSNIAQTYQISYNIEGNYKNFWPTVVDGFNRQGTLFDAERGKRLPPSANVVVNREYLLILQKAYFYSNDDVTKVKVGAVSNYQIYKVKAIKMSRNAADFFLKYGVRLTDNPTELTQLYPFAVKSPNVLLHNAEQVWFHKTEGCVEVYPMDYSLNSSKQIFAVKSGFQQILSVSRFDSYTSVLHYILLHKVCEKDLQPTERVTEVKVYNSKDELIQSGVYSILPAKRVFYIFAEYDGRIDVLKGETIINRIVVKSNQRTYFDIEQNRSYRIYQGSDCAYEVAFVHKKMKSADSDEQMVRKLQTFKGNHIAVSHTFGSVVASMTSMPLTKIWLLRQINSGTIDRRAKEFIQQYARGDYDGR